MGFGGHCLDRWANCCAFEFVHCSVGVILIVLLWFDREWDLVGIGEFVFVVRNDCGSGGEDMVSKLD